MLLNWNHLIDFMEQRWILNKKDIASILNYRASELSRPVPIKYAPEVAYNLIFKLSAANKGERLESMASKMSEEESYLLDALRVFLTEAECVEDAEFIATRLESGDEYECIMLELLKRANTQPSKKASLAKKNVPHTSPQGEPSPSLHNDTDDAVLQNKTPAEQMIEILVHSYRECHITEFLGADMYPGIAPNLLTWAERFIKTIEFDVLESYEHQNIDPTYINIRQFIEALRNYKDYIKENTRPWQRDVDRLVPRCNDYAESVKYHRTRILNLYKKVRFGDDFCMGKF